MNSCVLLAELVGDPELRYTPDNLPIAEVLVQFPGLRPDDPPATLKVVGFGNLATEIQQQFRQGDRAIFEGRLSMNAVDRPEGFREKRAELRASRVHRVSALGEAPFAAAPAPGAPAVAAAPAPSVPAPSVPAPSAPAPAPAPAPPPPQDEPDYDDIPF